MKGTVPYKKIIPPDPAWNIADAKFHSRWGCRRHYNHKRYFLNIFNRKLRRLFKKQEKEWK